MPGVSTIESARRISAGAVVSVIPSGRDPVGELGAVLEDAHARGGRRHALLENARPEQRVDEGALAGVELAHHHEQERLRELVARVGEGLARRVRDAEALEPGGHLAREAARLVEQGLPGGVERGAHGSSITPSRNLTAWPAISTRSPRSSHHSSPPRFETWRAKRLVLPRRFDQ